MYFPKTLFVYILAAFRVYERGVAIKRPRKAVCDKIGFMCSAGVAKSIAYFSGVAKFNGKKWEGVKAPQKLE